MDKCPTCGCADVKWKDMEAIEWAIKTLGLDESNEEAIRKAIAGEGRLVLSEQGLCATCKSLLMNFAGGCGCFNAGVSPLDIRREPPGCDKWEERQMSEEWRKEDSSCGMCAKAGVPLCEEGENFLSYDELDDAAICKKFVLRPESRQDQGGE